MKLKKFPQSCALLTSKSGAKLLIDPGKIDFDEAFVPDWKSADAVLVTHRHSDHFYAELVSELGVKIYSTQEVKTHNEGVNIEVVKSGDKIKVKDFEIEVVDAKHGFLPKMKYNGGEILENVGYIVSCDGVSIYFSSDTICFNNNYRADYAFIAVTGCGITMSAYEAAFVVKDMGAKLAIICHQDNTKLFPKNTDYIDKMMTENGVNYIIPKYLEEIELK